MNVLGVLVGAGFAGGLLLFLTALAGRDGADGTPARRRRKGRLQLTDQEQKRAIVAAGGGLVAAVFTGWLALIVVLPAAVVGVPRLLSSKSDRDRIELLDALEQYTRNLASVTATTSVTGAISATLTSTPARLRGPNEKLVTRLRARQSPEVALRAWADEVDDVAGDLIACTLVMAESASGRGLTQILNGLATQISAQVRQRRAIESDRSTPRWSARWVMGVAALMLGWLVQSEMGEFYRTPAGQIVLLFILGAFVLCFWWLKAASTFKPPTRLLPPSSPKGASA
ncbi:type II secretion system F family protein [Luteipulveratus halotolerans]|uniref:Type II secretion system protein GspF domain-containing protein n=1 Tax=Luteipulveratus halotolerans TaxID=1631356 RepID=A0A0L6CDE1_9MICO|nr:hypothetical protein [Luteipulveratus halotolerans]KNX35906.1 hypothetical protein VV01_21860 [Luteipulveratus halotolerans]